MQADWLSEDGVREARDGRRSGNEQSKVLISVLIAAAKKPALLLHTSLLRILI
jgi:hypothetical protein